LSIYCIALNTTLIIEFKKKTI